MDIVPLPKAKRIFDIIISFLVIILGSPFITLVVLALVMQALFIPSARGPLFYGEIRISQGQPFKLYKFRIFKVDSLRRFNQHNGFIQTKEIEHHSQSLTPVGRLLKQVYLDELPQLVNVLRGDMSLVGPRPTNPVNFARGRERGNIAKAILKAGITNYFQAYKGRKLDRTQEQLDLEYAALCHHKPGWEIVLHDCKVLLITLLTILRAEGI